MGIAAILLNGAKFWTNCQYSLDRRPYVNYGMWNLVEIVQAVSEKKTVKGFKILYMYIAQGQGQIAPKIFTVAK